MEDINSLQEPNNPALTVLNTLTKIIKNEGHTSFTKWGLAREEFAEFISELPAVKNLDEITSRVELVSLKKTIKPESKEKFEEAAMEYVNYLLQ